MPEKEIPIEQLWAMVNKGIEAAREKDTRLQAAEDRILKLRQLIPQEIRIPKPQEIPAWLETLRNTLWGE